MSNDRTKLDDLNQRCSTMFMGSLGLAATGVSLGALYMGQNRLLYPSWAQGARSAENMKNPSDYDLPYKHVMLTAIDGVSIEGYDLRNDNPDVGSTCLILCPNAGNIGYFIPIMAKFYQDLHMNVFIFSYRGYGKSQGSPSEKGIKLDVDCVMDYLSNDEFHNKKKLVLYGRSLGGAVAIHIASKFSEICQGVILENTFLNIRKVIPYFAPYVGFLAKFCRDMWNSELEIKNCSTRTSFLFLSGLEDEIVPPEHMTELYELCPSADKEFHKFPLGRHNNTINQDGYWDLIKEYLEEHQFIPISEEIEMYE